MKFSPGCNCCGTPFTGTLKGCNDTATGVGIDSVTIKDGATVLWTGAPNAGGVYSGTASLPATVTVEVVPSIPNFAPFSGSAAVTGTATKTIAPVTLSAGSGYHCSASCAVPVKDILQLVGMDTSTSPCLYDWPDDTLTYGDLDPVPTNWDSTETVGWLGATTFDLSPTLTGLKYFLTLGCILRVVNPTFFRNETSGVPICPPSFLLSRTCRQSQQAGFTDWWGGTITE